MPLYEYICNKCKNDYEGFKEEKCPKCGAIGTRKISITNFCIKGSCSNPLAPEAKKEPIETPIIKKKVFADWYCNKCNNILEDEFKYTDEEVKCPKCNSLMIQMVGKANFSLVYNPKTDIVDWQGNKSQYWSAVKEARRQGKNVKGHNEN